MADATTVDVGAEIVAVLRAAMNGIIGVGAMRSRLAELGVTLTDAAVAAIANGDE